MTTAERLRYDAGLSVSQVAQGAGVSRTTVHKLENGQPVAAGPTKAIADFLATKLERPIAASELVEVAA